MFCIAFSFYIYNIKDVRHHDSDEKKLLETKETEKLMKQISPSNKTHPKRNPDT